MMIAIPTVDGKVSAHFGHCSSYRMYLVEDCSIREVIEKEGPEHEPGVIPRWLKTEGADVVIAGGMGQKAIQLFDSLGIQTVVGVSSRDADEVAQEYLAGKLANYSNLCDH